MSKERWFRGGEEEGAFDWRRPARTFEISFDVARGLYARALRRTSDIQQAEALYLRWLRHTAAERRSQEPVPVHGRRTRVLPGELSDIGSPTRVDAAIPGKRTRVMLEARDTESDGERLRDVVERATAGTPQEVPFRAQLERFFDRPLPAITAFTGRGELRELGARAAAMGRTVMFADAQPSLPVVAHEVTHALQQERARPLPRGSRPELAEAGTPAEREADAAAHAIAAGRPAFRVREQPAASLHFDRDLDPPPQVQDTRGAEPTPLAGSAGAAAARSVTSGHHAKPAAARAKPAIAAHRTAQADTTHPHGADARARHPARHAGHPDTSTMHVAASALHTPSMTSHADAAPAEQAFTSEKSLAGDVLHGASPEVSEQATGAGRAALEAVRAAAVAGRTTLLAQITASNQAVAAAVQRQQQQVRQTGTVQRTTIVARFAAARVHVDTAVAAARTRVDGGLALQRVALTAWHGEATRDAAAMFTEKQTRASELGETYAQRAIETADAAASNARTRIQGRAAEARRIGAQKAAAARGDADEVRAMRGAAQQVSADTATEITHGLDDLMRSLRDQGPQTAQGFRDQGHQAASQLGEGLPQLQSQIAEANTATGGQLDQLAASARQNLEHLAAQLHRALAELQQQVLAELDRQLQQKHQQLETAGQQSIAAFTGEGRRALAAGDAHVATFMRSAAGLASRDATRAAAAGAQAAARVTVGYTEAAAQVNASGGSATGAIERAGGDAVGAFAGISMSVAAQIEQSVDAGRTQAAQAADATTAQLTQTVAQTHASGTQMVQQVARSLDVQLQQIAGSFESGLNDFSTNLDGQVSEAETKAAEPLASLPGRIDQAMERAAAQTHKSWLERQWDDFVEMASDPGFWAGLLTGIVLGLIVLAVVVLGGVTLGLGAIVLIGLAIGAACAAVGTIVSNLSADPPRPWHQGLVQNVLLGAGLGALGGLVIGAVALSSLTGAAAFFAGLAATEAVAFVGTVVTNLISGQPWDKGLLANLAIAGLLHGFFEAVRGGVRGGGNTEPEPNAPRGGGAADDPNTTPRSPAAGDSDPATTPKPPTASDSDPATSTSPSTADPADASSGRRPGVRVIRQDDDFSAQTNSKDVPKSHLDADGNLVPADPNGGASALEHIYGSSPAKDSSPYTSLMSEGPGGAAKTYGANEIEVDVGRLHTDIESGAVTGVEIITPQQIEVMIRNDIQAVKPGFDTDAALAGGTPDSIQEYLRSQPGISRTASAKLFRRLLALFNTTRDGEYLIRGVVPSDYIVGPNPSGGSGTVPPATP